MQKKKGDLLKMEQRTINANPTKEFFVNMLVRDIQLKQAVIELIDNSIDGAKRIRNTGDYTGLTINVSFNAEEFRIKDNCGGIPLDVAENYAFRFGRPKNAKLSNNVETTGIFGIGMKRALFKLGNKFTIISDTKASHFKVTVDVIKWITNDDNGSWDFEFEEYEDNMNNSYTGTEIIVTNLHREISSELGSETFCKELKEHAQKRVGLDIYNGTTIKINGEELLGDSISLVNSESVHPIKETYTHGDVYVTIIAGTTSKNEKTNNYEPEKAGWYIYCNDRLVVAADKTSLTTWKDAENKNNGVLFHNTYAPFRGAVYFNSNKPDQLPWNTTKTGIDDNSAVYIEAKSKMLDIFQIVKGFLEKVKDNSDTKGDSIEETISRMPSTTLTKKAIKDDITVNKELSITKVKPKVENLVTISYKKPKKEVDMLKKALGVSSNADVGKLTFDYYKDMEL